MKNLLSRYHPRFVATIIYMLQVSEYHVGDYLRWFWGVNDFNTVSKRGELTLTLKARSLRAIAYALMILLAGISAIFIMSGGWYMLTGVVLALAIPWLIAHSIILPLWIGEVFIQRPRQNQLKQIARETIAAHSATKIAIAGSFGKTSAKEILTTVLAEGRRVASTPGNMNTLIGTSRFIQSLQGDEDIIIFELGESHVGDIRELCELIEPDIGIITGINEAHLSTFGSIENTIATIFELKDYLRDKPLYLNTESTLVRKNLPKGPGVYSYGHHGVNGWVVSDVETSLEGTHFSIAKNSKVIWAKTALVGEHHLGILSAAVDIADRFGMDVSDITEGLNKVVPFEHRMAPRKLHGAWIIDDTYNGNIEGVEAGLSLLAKTEATRKIYVTPGLVEQGDSTEEIHKRIGELVAKVADVVVLMNNSVTPYVSKGLESSDFQGETMIVDDPLDFYSNLDQFVAAGDVVLMQNDWTDNYH